MYIKANIYEEKKKKECSGLIFQASFRLKEKREYIYATRRRGPAAAAVVASAPSVVWQCLFFSFSYFSCSLSARGNTPPPFIYSPYPPHYFPSPQVLPPPLPSPPPIYTRSRVRFSVGTMWTTTTTTMTMMRWRSVYGGWFTGGFVFKSFFLILTLTNTQRFIISCLPPPTYTCIKYIYIL